MVPIIQKRISQIQFPMGIFTFSFRRKQEVKKSGRSETNQMICAKIIYHEKKLKVSETNKRDSYSQVEIHRQPIVAG